jgi:hypothetical protein
MRHQHRPMPTRAGQWTRTGRGKSQCATMQHRNTKIHTCGGKLPNPTNLEIDIEIIQVQAATAIHAGKHGWMGRRPFDVVNIVVRSVKLQQWHRHLAAPQLDCPIARRRQKPAIPIDRSVFQFRHTDIQTHRHTHTHTHTHRYAMFGE